MLTSFFAFLIALLLLVIKVILMSHWIYRYLRMLRFASRDFLAEFQLANAQLEQTVCT